MTEPRPTPSCIIFDCDGVLIDSELIASRVAAEHFTASGAAITVEEMLERFAGVSALKVTETVFSERGLAVPPNATETRRDAIIAALERDVTPMPGIHALLDRIEIKMCVASSSHPDRLAATLRRTDLDRYFEGSVFSAFSVAKGKPAPDLFYLAADTMRVPREACVVVEDSVAGVAAALAAGMGIVGFTGGSHCGPDHAAKLRDAGAETVIDSLSKLPDVVPGIA